MCDKDTQKRVLLHKYPSSQESPLTRIETFRIFSQFGVSIGIRKCQLDGTSLNRNRGNCIDEGTGRSEGNIQAVSEQLKNNTQYVNGHHVKRLYHSCF